MRFGRYSFKDRNYYADASFDLLLDEVGRSLQELNGRSERNNDPITRRLQYLQRTEIERRGKEQKA